MTTRFYAASLILSLGVACTDANEGNPPADAGANNPATDSGPTAANDAGSRDDTGPASNDAGAPLTDSGPPAPLFDAGPAEQGDDCETILRCAFTCPPGDQGCIDGCFSNAKPSHVAPAREVFQCVADSGCNPEDRACAARACGDQIDQCMAISGPGTGLNDYVCMEGIFCAIECLDDGCIHQCIAGVVDDQENIARAVMECAERANCRDMPCLEERCPEVLFACSGDDEPAGRCVEAMQCLMNECDLAADNRDECCNECGAVLAEDENPDARQAYQAICGCVQTNDCNDRECLEASCIREFETCMQ
jgi:hypothetical protein